MKTLLRAMTRLPWWQKLIVVAMFLLISVTWAAACAILTINLLP